MSLYPSLQLQAVPSTSCGTLCCAPVDVLINKLPRHFSSPCIHIVICVVDKAKVHLGAALVEIQAA
eukprot:53758-Rhodomonas_salina.1